MMKSIKQQYQFNMNLSLNIIQANARQTTSNAYQKIKLQRFTQTETGFMKFREF